MAAPDEGLNRVRSMDPEHGRGHFRRSSRFPAVAQSVDDREEDAVGKWRDDMSVAGDVLARHRRRRGTPFDQ